VLAKLFVLGRRPIEKRNAADVHLCAAILLEQKRGVCGAEVGGRACSPSCSLGEQLAYLGYLLGHTPSISRLALASDARFVVDAVRADGWWR
jgi:hypothetical protein